MDYKVGDQIELYADRIALHGQGVYPATVTEVTPRGIRIEIPDEYNLRFSKFEIDRQHWLFLIVGHDDGGSAA